MNGVFVIAALVGVVEFAFAEVKAITELNTRYMLGAFIMKTYGTAESCVVVEIYIMAHYVMMLQ